ncbi:ABC transporter substrate-binding protein [Catenovulum sp. SM1970]|uniref:MlaC/ttg2D family ABC transporter substrate-binding protein n=1 Tax=Marinifaba aquimaris TaxID=2741323 RepID=UPI00157481A3|nr:ABC transporter substrate-binding protein [Marinifaba aquimaris]NTS78387.1 ABC transporter substrate-binding protein [Marinifaba aquimaris]
MNKHIASFFIFFAVLLISLNTAAAHKEAGSPYQVVKVTGEHLFSRIQLEQTNLKSDPKLMQKIVLEELMPVVDHRYAAYKILGKTYKKMTKQQRKDFVVSMKNYLVKTYANALMQYDDQQVIYQKPQAIKGKKLVSVATKIVADGAPEISLVFKMRQNKKTQQWKAYDMVVEGISLIASKQAEFKKRISQKGIEQVTLELAAL